MRRALWGGLVLTLSATPIGAGESLMINVSPSVAFAPGRVIVRATVERNTANRALEIVAESTDYYRSSTVHLDGDQAAKTTVVRFKSLPLGKYRVSALLRGVEDKILATVHRTVIVTEPEVVIVR